jgi:uncharacterized membrane protein YadS
VRRDRRRPQNGPVRGEHANFPDKDYAAAGAALGDPLTADVVVGANAFGRMFTGAAAIAAVEDALRAGRTAVAGAVWMVTAWGSLMTAGTMPKVPWFVLAFVAAIGVRSTGLLPAGVLDVGSAASLFQLAVGMVGLGLGVRLATLWPMSWRVVVLSGASTLIALTVSGVLVLTLVG